MSRSDDGNQRTIVIPAHLFRKKKKENKTITKRRLYPKSTIMACLDFAFLEEWILFGF